MKEPRRNSGEELELRIDRTLGALGRTEPLPGFQDRLLAGLDRPAEPATYRLALIGAEFRERGGERLMSRLWRDYGPLFGPLTAMAVVAAFLLGYAVVRKGVMHPRAQQARSSVMPKTSSFPDAPSQAANPRDRSSRALASVVRVGSLSRLGATANPLRPATPTIALELSTTAQVDPDQQAVADLDAPSQPAPPLAPTAQERLVRLMLRRGEKHELADLELARNPDLQRAETAAFHNFFDPPSAIEKQSPSTPEKPAPAASSATPQP